MLTILRAAFLDPILSYSLFALVSLIALRLVIGVSTSIRDHAFDPRKVLNVIQHDVFGVLIPVGSLLFVSRVILSIPDLGDAAQAVAVAGSAIYLFGVGLILAYATEAVAAIKGNLAANGAAVVAVSAGATALPEVGVEVE